MLRAAVLDRLHLNTNLLCYLPSDAVLDKETKIISFKYKKFTSKVSPTSRKPAMQEYIPFGYLGCLMRRRCSCCLSEMLTMPTGEVEG